MGLISAQKEEDLYFQVFVNLVACVILPGHEQGICLKALCLWWGNKVAAITCASRPELKLGICDKKKSKHSGQGDTEPGT